MRAQWDRHLQRWPQPEPARASQADRAADEPGSWRGDAGQYLNAEENLVAGHALDRVRAAEPAVTAAMRAVEATVPGASLAGLEHRLKGEDRFKEKVAAELHAKPDRSIAEIAERMPDTIRYTVESDPEKYAETYSAGCAEMQKSGSVLLMSRNSWQTPDYKGINTRWLVTGGNVIEVQFHTAESFAAKQLTHGAYERLRAGTAPGPERPELERFQQVASSHIPEPVNVAAIADYRRKGY
ncbi:MAG: hypothetical protein ACLQDY_25435 [Streptosporangiaceae bacterium]